MTSFVLIMLSFVLLIRWLAIGGKKHAPMRKISNGTVMHEGIDSGALAESEGPTSVL